MLSFPSSVRLLRRFRALAERTEHSGSVTRTSVIFASAEAGRNSLATKACTLKSSSLFDEGEGFLFIGHEIGAAMAGDHYSAASIPHPCRPVPIPTFEIAVKKAAREGVTSPQDVIHLDGKRRSLDRFAAL